MTNTSNTLNKNTLENFKILAWPAFSLKGGNPYTKILYKSIQDQGIRVKEFDITFKDLLKFTFNPDFKVFHIHWPSHVLYGDNPSRAKRRLLAFCLFLSFLKLLQKKIVWTVHNLEPHNNTFPHLQRKLDRFLYKNVDGFISLNREGLNPIKKEAKDKGKQKFVHILHPHYHSYYPNNVAKCEARRSLSIPANSFVFLFLGQIRAYKNVVELVRAFKKLNRADTFLLIAGHVHKEVETDLLKEIDGTDRILFKDSFINDEDLQLYFNSSDVVVTPYSQIFNSGSAILNLSFSKPTLAPDVWALSELENIFGSRWVRTYQPPISAEILEECMISIKNETVVSANAKPDISLLHPQKIAKETLAFYQSILN